MKEEKIGTKGYIRNANYGREIGYEGLSRERKRG